jgi:UDPglucose 6-dehydrogenase
LENASALVIATEWSEFRTPDFELMDKVLQNNKNIFDGRNLFDLDKMMQRNYNYVSVGRK